MIYETERLVVRAWTADDADVDRLHDLYSRWEVARWLGSNPRAMVERAEAAAAVVRWEKLHAEDPRFGAWAVQVRDTGVVAGTVLYKQLPNSDEIEVGWHFHPESWGHGYASESARGALDRGFTMGVSEVYAVVRPDNHRSLAVCRRLGMGPLGRTNRWYDLELEAFRLAAPARETIRR